MASFYDQVEIEDFEFDEASGMYTYPCPCGDKFQITLSELMDGEEVAKCPSCSLMIQVIYDKTSFTRSEDRAIVFPVSV